MKPEERFVDISCPLEKVWDAALAAFPLAGWELTTVGKPLGHFEARVGMSIWTWGENFSVDLRRIGEGSTRVEVRGKVRYQYYDWGKTRKDIERFISMLLIVLKERLDQKELSA